MSTKSHMNPRFCLNSMKFSTPWCNGEDIDSPDANLRHELEATLRRIRVRKNRKKA